MISAVEEEHAAFFTYMGIASAIVFSNLGSAYSIAKTCVDICSMAVLRPELINYPCGQDWYFGNLWINSWCFVIYQNSE